MSEMDDDERNYIIEEEILDCDQFFYSFISNQVEIEPQLENLNGGDFSINNYGNDFYENSKINDCYSFDFNQQQKGENQFYSDMEVLSDQDDLISTETNGKPRMLKQKKCKREIIPDSNQLQLEISSLSSQLSTPPQQIESDNQINTHQNQTTLEQNQNQSNQVITSEIEPKFSSKPKKKKYSHPSQNFPGFFKRFILDLARNDDDWQIVHDSIIDPIAKKKKKHSLSDINNLLSIESLKERFIQSLENNEFLLYILDSDKLCDVKSLIEAIHVYHYQIKFEGKITTQTLGKSKKKQSKQ